VRLIRLGFFAVLALPLTQGATIVTENFDELTPMLSATSVGAFQTIGGTNVDIVGSGLFGNLCVSPESVNCVDMDGSNGNPQGILQTVSSFTLSPGVNYFLSFDLIGSQRGNTASTTVTVGTSGCSGAGCAYSQTFNLATGDDTDGIVSNALITVSAVTTAFLTFTSNTPGASGNLLDDVLLSSASANGSVPEPSSMLLVGAALLGVSLLARRLGRV
jgi:PEP-CTERM motif